MIRYTKMTGLLLLAELCMIGSGSAVVWMRDMFNISGLTEPNFAYGLAPFIAILLIHALLTYGLSLLGRRLFDQKSPWVVFAFCMTLPLISMGGFFISIAAAEWTSGLGPFWDRTDEGIATFTRGMVAAQLLPFLLIPVWVRLLWQNRKQGSTSPGTACSAL